MCLYIYIYIRYVYTYHISYIYIYIYTELSVRLTSGNSIAGADLKHDCLGDHNVYIYIYICIYICICMCVYLSLSLYIYIYTYTHYIISMHIHVCIYIYMYVCIYIYIYITRQPQPQKSELMNLLKSTCSEQTQLCVCVKCFDLDAQLKYIKHDRWGRGWFVWSQCLADSLSRVAGQSPSCPLAPDQ